MKRDLWKSTCFDTRHLRAGRLICGVIAAGALAALPALTGCAGVDTASASEASLDRFTSCASLTRYAREHALAMVGPYGLGGGVAQAMAAATGVAEDRAAAPSAAAAVAGTDFSATNAQEAGVDEPDIVKSDGTRIFAVARNRIYAVDASGPQPRIAGSVALPAGSTIRDMLLSGDRLLVMSDGQVGVARSRRAPAGPGGAIPEIFPAPPSGSVLTALDVSDPGAMRTVQTLRSDARYVTARLSGTTARIVMSDGPPALAYPAEPGPVAEARALAANRDAVMRTTAGDWLPSYTVETGGAATAPRPIAPCTAVARPPAFAGLDTLTVLTVDLARGLEPVDADTVMASGENVYASPDALYVATNRWAPVDASGRIDGANTTHIHKFATTGPQTTYRGSGSVTGHLLNQFSMSELDGRLRVATTDEATGLIGGDAVVSSEGGGGSESFVTVLEERGRELRQVGRVGGLGKGERIFAVRFIGATGYVVTFRQTDPLYTVDLSDPTTPRVAGELKIAGYSAYLHPAGDGLLIGVGQDADGDGRTTGLQVSLFDVSDPAAPKRLSRGVMPGATSEAEWDHHAFLWWPKTSLAVIPFNRYDIAVPAAEAGGVEPGSTGSAGGGVKDIPPMRQVNGALGMRVTRAGVGEVGRVSHPAAAAFDAGIRRSLVIGDALYTVSNAGIRASALSDLSERAWLAFS